jgi:diguanylate cyclase (GGDEF)-like protein
MNGAVDKVTETWVNIAKPPVSGSCRDACLVRIYPTGAGMGTRYPLGNTPIVLGRENTCDIPVNDQSASRRHARIERDLEGYFVIDLQSTNGTFVNDKPASTTQLRDGDYLRVGNYIFRFLAGGNVEADYHMIIYRLTIIDSLTEIHNQRYLLEFLDRELARSARYKRPLALIMLDLDRFKEVNDTHSHLGGDYTLRELVNVIRQAIRREELFARYGGEEFALVLPETGRDGALELAERIRRLVEEHQFNYDGKPFRITISLGVYATQGEETLTPTELIRRADLNLFTAKNGGRNQVVG